MPPAALVGTAVLGNALPAVAERLAVRVSMEQRRMRCLIDDCGEQAAWCYIVEDSIAMCICEHHAAQVAGLANLMGYELTLYRITDCVLPVAGPKLDPTSPAIEPEAEKSPRDEGAGPDEVTDAEKQALLDGEDY